MLVTGGRNGVLVKTRVISEEDKAGDGNGWHGLGPRATGGFGGSASAGRRTCVLHRHGGEETSSLTSLFREV